MILVKSAWVVYEVDPSVGGVGQAVRAWISGSVKSAWVVYKAECVYGPDTTGWDDVDELELATLSWVHWFNEDRLHGHCGDVPPAEYESAFYAAQQSDLTEVGIQETEPPTNPGWFTYTVGAMVVEIGGIGGFNHLKVTVRG